MTQRHSYTLGAMALLAIFALAQPGGSHAEEMQVSVDNFTYSPQQITIKAGTTVVWANHDDIPHTVTSTTSAFKSAVLDTDEKFSFTFVTPGTYPYFCALHPHMTGSIVVEAGAK